MTREILIPYYAYAIIMLNTLICIFIEKRLKIYANVNDRHVNNSFLRLIRILKNILCMPFYNFQIL